MFDERAKEEEYLDQPDCDPELAAKSYRFMEMINRVRAGSALLNQFCWISSLRCCSLCLLPRQGRLCLFQQSPQSRVLCKR